MKAVATALVLIAGAAVVLWYGNTLNSWVVGGLIGGLAALLLSIPISLTLFSYLSRRHDERLRMDAQEEIAFSQEHDYPDYQRISARVPREAYIIEEEYLPEEEEPLWDEQEEYIQHAYGARNLPAPVHTPPQRPQPVRQTPNRALVPQQREAYESEEGRQQQKALPRPNKINEAPARRTTSQKMNYPGFPGYTPTTSLSQYRSAALRAARQEVVQRHEEEMDILPTNVSRRTPSVYPGLSTTGQRAIQKGPEQERPRRTVEATPSQSGQRRALPSGHRDTRHQIPQYAEPRTEALYEQHPDTEQLQRQFPNTGKIGRHPRIEEQRQNPDIVTGSLQNPLVRRAPYMYEDDPLRQELSQQLDAPAVRRSSRRETIRQDEYLD